MVSPLDAKVTFEVEGEAITLRLNFRALALCEQRGVDMFSPTGINMTLTNAVQLLRSLAVTDHPDMDEDEALAVVVKYGMADFGARIGDLIVSFGGETEGNEKAAKKPD
jgi:hypothetical protein